MGFFYINTNVEITLKLNKKCSCHLFTYFTSNLLLLLLEIKTVLFNLEHISGPK